jgi:hypothetical protein
MDIVEGLPPQLEGMAHRKPRLVLGKHDPRFLVAATVLGDLGRGLPGLGLGPMVGELEAIGPENGNVIAQYGYTSIWVDPKSPTRSGTSEEYGG